MASETIRLRKVVRSALKAGAVLALVSTTAVAKDAAPPPFEISWTRGVCAKCENADRIGGVRFAADRDIWAFGYLPPGDVGWGDGTVLHSRDGGLTWRELGWTFTHNGWPMASFSSAREGWVAAPDQDQGGAELRLTYTRDGSTWRRRPQPDFFTQAIQYLGHGIGFAAGFNPYTHAAVLYRTDDGGRRWAARPLPRGMLVDQMRFADGQRGYLAGCMGRRVTILSTSDAGRSWSRTQLPLPPADPQQPTCTFSADGMLSIGSRGAWLVVSKHVYGRNDRLGEAGVWRTVDGGRRWTQAYRTSWTQDLDHGLSLAGPYALSPNMIVVFENAGKGGSKAIFTADGGRTWSSEPVARPIAGCAQNGPALTCAESEPKGFWVAKVAAP